MLLQPNKSYSIIFMVKEVEAGPVASKHGNLIPPLNAGSMVLGSTNFRQRHKVGKGGEQGRVGERTRGTGETGNRHGTDTGEAGESGRGKEAKGGGKE